MAKLKKAHYSFTNSANATVAIDTEILIDSAGIFYAHIPDRMKMAFDHALIDHRERRAVEGKFKIRAKTLEEIERAIEEGLERYAEPSITEEPVIRYNIESHVLFAETPDGSIVPNASWEGARWPDDRGRFGNHHATNMPPGGYSLIIGATAEMKTTHQYGEKKAVKYKTYYKGGSHHGHDNPAELLNSWAGMDVGKSPKEIPYTDEAALFFHSLLMSMATISRRIQEATFTQADLLALIASQTPAVALLTSPTPAADPTGGRPHREDG